MSEQPAVSLPPKADGQIEPQRQDFPFAASEAAIVTNLCPISRPRVFSRKYDVFDAKSGPFSRFIREFRDREKGLWQRGSKARKDRKCLKHSSLRPLAAPRPAACEDDLPTGELATLAKVLVDARRALGERSKESEKSVPTAEATQPPGELPEPFCEAVRRVYGTNFRSPTETAGVSESETADAER